MMSHAKFEEKLVLVPCHENHQLAYKCRQLKNVRKIHSTWFWKNAVNVKLSERSNPVKFLKLLTLKNFLALTILILLPTLHFKCSHLLYYVAFSILCSLPTLVTSYKPFSFLSDCANRISSRYTLVFF